MSLTPWLRASPPSTRVARLWPRGAGLPDAGARGDRARSRYGTAPGAALHGAAGQGGAYWDAEIKRAQGRSARLPGLHAPGPRRPQLPGLRGRWSSSGRDLPAVRHAQRAATLAAVVQMAHAIKPDSSCSACMAWARASTASSARRTYCARARLRPGGRAPRPAGFTSCGGCLENGANSSFVHQLSDPEVPVAQLLGAPLPQPSPWPALAGSAL